MQLVSKCNKEFRFLLSVIDIYSKYEWVIPLKDKNGIKITNVFQKFLKESNRKPKKIWVNKSSELKCIQHIMKENMLLQKNSLEP